MKARRFERGVFSMSHPRGRCQGASVRCIHDAGSRGRVILSQTRRLRCRLSESESCIGQSTSTGEELRPAVWVLLRGASENRRGSRHMDIFPQMTARRDSTGAVRRGQAAQHSKRLPLSRTTSASSAAAVGCRCITPAGLGNEARDEETAPRVQSQAASLAVEERRGNEGISSSNIPPHRTNRSGSWTVVHTEPSVPQRPSVCSGQTSSFIRSSAERGNRRPAQAAGSGVRSPMLWTLCKGWPRARPCGARLPWTRLQALYLQQKSNDRDRRNGKGRDLTTPIVSKHKHQNIHRR